MIKVYSIRLSKKEISVTPLGNRLYKLNQDLSVSVITNQGIFTYRFCKGFITNFRSGGLFVDRFIDQIGSSVKIQACWLVHDAAYTPCAACKGEHPISRQLADELLKAMLIYSGMGKVQATAVYYSVHWFGRSAYEEDDNLTEANSVLFTFSWAA